MPEHKNVFRLLQRLILTGGKKMKTIVCYGDSNTYGYNPENGFRYEYEERWTTILQKELKDSAIVIPEGLNGRTTSFEDELRPGRNGATYLDPCLHSHGPIDLVVLMLGTNDLKIRFQATPTDIGKGIDRLIKMIKSITPQKRQDGQSAKILLMSPPHLGANLVAIPSGEEMGYERGICYCLHPKGIVNGFERGISYSKRLAPIYEDWAKFHNIEFLDAAKYANPSEIDACHLTRESHRKLGKMVAKKCKEILEI